MADYRKMYAILCRAVDEVIEPLEQIPLARGCAQGLKSALQKAEETYIDTAGYGEQTENPQVIVLRHRWPKETSEG